jgi:hypothetical protein
MSAAHTPTPSEDRVHSGVQQRRRSRRIPHSAFGIGAFLLVLLAAVTLVLLSGQLTRHPGATMVVLIGIPAMIVFTVVVAKTWRRHV